MRGVNTQIDIVFIQQRYLMKELQKVKSAEETSLPGFMDKKLLGALRRCDPKKVWGYSRGP